MRGIGQRPDASTAGRSDAPDRAGLVPLGLIRVAAVANLEPGTGRG